MLERISMKDAPRPIKPCISDIQASDPRGGDRGWSDVAPLISTLSPEICEEAGGMGSVSVSVESASPERSHVATRGEAETSWASCGAGVSVKGGARRGALVTVVVIFVGEARCAAGDDGVKDALSGSAGFAVALVNFGRKDLPKVKRELRGEVAPVASVALTCNGA